MPTDIVNATSESNSETLNITDDLIKSHPLYQELENKYSAAHKKMDESNITAKEAKAEAERLRKATSNDQVQYVTKEELWEHQNASDIELYSDETYESEIAAGVPKNIALQYAKLRYEKTPNDAQIQRQQANATGNTAGIRHIENTEITDADRRGMKEWGYSEATVLKHKQMKKAKGLL